MRIGIDVRRSIGCGVWRVAQNTVQALSNAGHHLVTFDGGSNDSLPVTERISCPIGYHTKDDHTLSARIIDDAQLDFFIAPQYYAAPSVRTQTIRFIHDLWPLLYPKWLPTLNDFSARYGNDCLTASSDFSLEFCSSSIGKKIINENARFAKYVEEHGRKPMALYCAAMFGLTIERAKVIVCPSAHTKAEIEYMFPTFMHKVVIIPNAVSSLFFKRSEVRIPYKDRTSILHIANWEPRKNIENLLQAFQLFSTIGHNAQLILVGNPGNSTYTMQINSIIAKHPYCSRIHKLGIVTDEEIAARLGEARFLVCPSLYEGFGIPVLEAMAAQVPVITGSIGALPGTAGAGAALYWNPHDPESMCSVLSRAWSDSTIIQDLINCGAKLAQEHRIEHTVALLESVLRAHYSDMVTHEKLS